MTNKEMYAEWMENSWNTHWERIDSIAKQCFQEHVKPVLRNRKMEFSAGMGLWFIETKDGQPIDSSYGTMQGESDPEIIKMIEVLTMDVPGYPNGDLGSLMPDYDGRNFNP